MLDRFIQVVNSQHQYNKLLPRQRTSRTVPAPEDIPIIVYHRIDNSGAQYSTNVSLFTEDNGFKFISLAD